MHADIFFFIWFFFSIMVYPGIVTVVLCAI